MIEEFVISNCPCLIDIEEGFPALLFFGVDSRSTPGNPSVAQYLPGSRDIFGKPYASRFSLPMYGAKALRQTFE